MYRPLAGGLSAFRGRCSIGCMDAVFAPMRLWGLRVWWVLLHQKRSTAAMLPWYHFALAASSPVHETSLMLPAELCPLQTHRLTDLTGTLLSSPLVWKDWTDMEKGHAVGLVTHHQLVFTDAYPVGVVHEGCGVSEHWNSHCSAQHIKYAGAASPCPAEAVPVTCSLFTHLYMHLRHWGVLWGSMSTAVQQSHARVASLPSTAV